MSIISDNLKYMRLLRGFSTAVVAEKIGCAPNTLTNWEKGKISPPANSVELLCELYEISPSELFGWEKYPELEEFKSRQKAYLDEIAKLEEQKAVLEKKLQNLKITAFSEISFNHMEKYNPFLQSDKAKKAAHERELSTTRNREQ